ncbi:MAG: type III pantothenate kinase [Gammaproteobacteria bacterium]
MKLLFDIGNTRIKWALDTGEGLSHHGEQLHRGVPLKEALKTIAGFSVDVDEVWAVNVAGKDIAYALSELTVDMFGVPPQFVSTARQCGEVTNGYKDVSQHGVDRWAAVIGAWQRYRSDLCVVDAGTAVTIDLVREDGRHQGGFILPGIKLMAEALFRDTSDIERFSARGEESDPEDWIGNSTFSAVQKGVLFALRSAVTESADRLGTNVRVIMTGGDAQHLMPLDGVTAEICADLVLQGLCHLIQEQ